MNKREHQSKKESAPSEAVRPDWKNKYFAAANQRDEMLALLRAISAFSFSGTENKLGYQLSLKAFVEFKRQARKLISAQEPKSSGSWSLEEAEEFRQRVLVPKAAQDAAQEAAQ